jgi:hypothetical protein
VVGTSLALVFWQPLATGAGLVGGDVYNYYFPLKKLYADGLHHNTLNFWHPGIGHGIDVLSESQTAALYPFNLLAYRWLPLNAAYNAVQIAHYVLTFVFTCWLARALGIGQWGTLLTALVFTYGWFPPRICLEWAIVTGTWAPLALGCTVRWLRDGGRRWLWGLAVVTCVQLTAGHFQLAFTTVLAVGVVTVCWRNAQPAWREVLRYRGAVLLALLAGFMLAAPQLFPTWQLKRRSDRNVAEFFQTVRYGRIPPWYLWQLVAPFAVYADPEGWLRAAGGDSNKTEAHLYFGLVPLALIGISLIGRRRGFSRRPWIALAGVGGTLAIGSAAPLLAHLPGFGFFRYPGRYGLMVQLAGAVLAGAALDAIGVRRRWATHLAAAGVIAATVVDLLVVARNPAIHQVTILRPPIAERIGESQIFHQLLPTDRVLAPDPNTLALSGASCVPHYLGMGPAEFEAIWSRLPNVFQSAPVPAEMIELLRRCGVTHLLTERPAFPDLPATLLWAGYDRFLHPRWGRDPAEPLYLYRFDVSLGRAYLRRDEGSVLPAKATIVDFSPHAVTIECECPEACELVVADLWWPGWRVTVDGQSALGRSDIDYPGRVVSLAPGRHLVRWRYVPIHFLQGCAVSAITLAAWLLMEIRLWRRVRRDGRYGQENTHASPGHN